MPHAVTVIFRNYIYRGSEEGIFMNRVHRLFRCSILSILITAVLLLVRPREALPADQTTLFDHQQMEFAGLASSYGESGGLLIAQKRDEEFPQPSSSEEEKNLLDDDSPGEDFPKDDFPEDELPLDEPSGIKDPLEPLNRAFFLFNDKLYFWVLKPVATGYSAVAPEPARIGISNFFYNLAFPVRFINCALQGKIYAASEEIRRFVINSTVGMAGFIDVATNKLEIKKYEEDLGQTFGLWGLGPAFYVNWPILGPSTFRDTAGFVGDAFFYPISFITAPSNYSFALNAFDLLNQTSLRIGDYEDLKKAAFDPYIALRDAYYQNRRSKIDE